MREVERVDKSPNLTAIRIGPDSIGWEYDHVPNHVVLAVYYYENGGYDGSGVIIYYNGKKFGYGSLSHCSCYGPLENIDWACDEELHEIEQRVKGEYNNKEYDDVIAEIRKTLFLSNNYGEGF